MRLSVGAARRIVLAAQGLAQPRPEQVTMRELTGMYRRIALTQIDSVNVLARAHFLPAFARLGPYPMGIYDRAAKGRPPRLIEYWAHEAALTTPEVWHLMRWRMDRLRHHPHWRAVLDDQPQLVGRVQQLIADHGPMTATRVHEEIGRTAGPKTHWGWNWSDEKRALEALFATGQLVAAKRNPQFERVYDLPERVLGPLPAAPSGAEAAVALIRLASRALGVATAKTLADYFRMRTDVARPAIAHLVALGELDEVEVDGWGACYLHPDCRRPRRVEARALLAPFDPLVFDRERLLALFGMHYRIGIYTPKEQRQHGYYVLPFLLGEQMVGRVDLKADRRSSRLVVQRLTWEAHAPGHAAQALDAELRLMADWLQLTDVVHAG